MTPECSRAGESFARLVDIMRRLRAPDGCPWDAEQTHDSLKRYLLEEAYEVLEAIDARDDHLLKEELGDLVLQPVFHAAIAEEQGRFAMADALDAICEKLVRRHPHVFGDQVIADSAAQIENWEKIKKKEKGGERRSTLSGIPPHLPALMKSQKLAEKASRSGFDWETVEQTLEKVDEELAELREAVSSGDRDAMESELGDLLFAVANVGRFQDIDPEEALRKTLERFARRFAALEEQVTAAGKSMKELSLPELERLWREGRER